MTTTKNTWKALERRICCKKLKGKRTPLSGSNSQHGTSADCIETAYPQYYFEMGGSSIDDSIWHRKIWRVELNRLLNCYIPNISQKTLLWLERIEENTKGEIINFKD